MRKIKVKFRLKQDKCIIFVDILEQCKKVFGGMEDKEKGAIIEDVINDVLVETRASLEAQRLEIVVPEGV